MDNVNNGDQANGLWSLGKDKAKAAEWLAESARVGDKETAGKLEKAATVLLDSIKDREQASQLYNGNS